MDIKTISVTYLRKINLGQYNSIELGMTAWADIGADENAQTCASALRAYCRENARSEALQLIEAIRSGRKMEKTDQIDPNVAERFLGEWQTLENSLADLIDLMGTFGEPPAPPSPVEQPKPAELSPTDQAKIEKGKKKMEKLLSETEKATTGELAGAPPTETLLETLGDPASGNTDPFGPTLS